MLTGNRILLWLLCCGAVTALPIGEFYPHGPAVDNFLPKLEDSSSPEIFLQTPIKFFGELYNSIFINDNGILSFLTDIPSFLNIQFPLEYPVIAPLYTNVDIRRAGDIYYRETQNPELLAKVSYNIRRLYPNLAAQFTAKSLFIVTWLNVGYYKEGSDRVNTYQVAISSDGEESFVEFLYKDGGIQWLQGTGVGAGLPDARAQVGFVSVGGRLYSLRGSGTDQVKNLDKWTNSEIPGLFTFRVGQISESENVEPPQITSDLETGTDLQTCYTSSTMCHSQAQCIDGERGFCCICRDGYYGNGRTCLKDGIPLRVNGKVSFNLNGLVFPNVDLQAYIVTTDSRSYTALSRVPGELGASLQLLILFPGIIGWLFAKPISDAKNGYQLTGGVFNHTVNIKFQNTQHQVQITQRFLGLDVFDQLRLEGEVYGSIPTLPNVNLSMPDHVQQFTRIGPGVLRSQSSHSLRIENSGQDFPMTIDQTVYFNEHCPLDNFALRLKTARNFLNYESTEKILRFASTTKISKISENEDPCLEGQVTCVANSSCLAEGDSFRCVCNPGFQSMHGSSATEDSGCVDINECSEGTSTCHVNAICINQVGSFSCQCRPGYTGNGHSCAEIESPCQRNPALCNPPNSYCQIPGNISTCYCNYGFDSIVLDEGFRCDDIDECQDTQICHPDATCENTEGSYKCTCNSGFYGDGRDCQWVERHTCEIVACGSGAECIEDPVEGAKCVCQKGFIGDGNTCRPEPEIIGDRPEKVCFNGSCFCPVGYQLVRDQCLPFPSANTFYTYETKGPSGSKQIMTSSCNLKCHKDAECVYTKILQSYECQCKPGYEGDGYDCSEMEFSCFDDLALCDPHASCVHDEVSGLGICKCDSGYQGNGMYCDKIFDCSSNEDCGPNSACSYNEAKGLNECVCLAGYNEVDGICYSECYCHPDADCFPDAVTGKSQCRCRKGFEGNGVETCEPVTTPSGPPSCNEVNNCSPTADCVFSATDSTYHCQCRPGYEGDGLVCHPVENCRTNASLCHLDAICVQASYNEFHCQCKPGFVGNGQKCREEYTGGDEFLLVNQGMATLRIPYHPTRSDPGYPIQLKTEQVALGLAVDCIEARVYWSDIMSQAIVSSAYNGADKENFIQHDIGSPEGLAIDWVNRNIYWTDSTKDTINVANLDTKEKKVIVSQGLVNPRGIAVHPQRRKIFWSDWNRASPKLEISQFDGSNRAIFVQGPAVQLPNSLAIDWQTDELCWADAGTKSIECIGITSYIRRTVVTNCSYPFGLAISSDKYYWTDWNTQKVESAWKATGAKADSIDVPLGGAGKLYGITTVTNSCPPA